MCWTGNLLYCIVAVDMLSQRTHRLNGRTVTMDVIFLVKTLDNDVWAEMDLQSHEKVADRPHDIASGRRSLYTADRTAHACFDSCCLSRSDCWVIIRLCFGHSNSCWSNNVHCYHCHWDKNVGYHMDELSSHWTYCRNRCHIGRVVAMDESS